jgi:DNA-binding transcriptional MerR regulator
MNEKLIRDFNQTYNYSDEDCLLVKELKALGFNIAQIAAILQLIDNTCKHCWNSNSDCNCTRDD